MQYSPVYTFTSELAGVSVSLPDEYATRETILADVYRNFRNWLFTALTRAPFEMQSLLQVRQLGATGR